MTSRTRGVQEVFVKPTQKRSGITLARVRPVIPAIVFGDEGASDDSPKDDAAPEEKDAVVQMPDSFSPRVVQLIGLVGEKMLRVFSMQLAELEAQSEEEPIVVEITTLGGGRNACFAIYDRLRATGMPIITIAYGTAQSAGSIILQAGDIRCLGESATVMIHNPAAVGEMALSLDESQALTKDLTRSAKRLHDLYARHTQLPISTIRKWCKEEKEFTAKSAVRNGLADVLLKPGFPAFYQAMSWASRAQKFKRKK